MICNHFCFRLYALKDHKSQKCITLSIYRYVTVANICDLTLTDYISGYGNVVVKTYWGKLLLMAYTTIGIPLSIAAYTYAAKFTIAVASVLIEAGEARLFKHHRRVRNKQAKVLIITFGLLLLLVIAAAYMTSHSELDNFEIVDSFYFWFCTLSTIGYGDYNFNLQNYVDHHPGLTLYIVFTFLFGLGLVATIARTMAQIIANSKARSRANKTSYCPVFCCRNTKYEIEINTGYQKT